jgi:hypothetical protein
MNIFLSLFAPLMMVICRPRILELIGITHIWEEAILVRGRPGALATLCLIMLSDGFRGPLIVHDTTAPYFNSFDEEYIMTGEP